MKAVLRALRQSGPARLVLAVPVAPADILIELSSLADEVVCVATPEPFHAVGAHYRDFAQTTDEEVIGLARAKLRVYCFGRTRTFTALPSLKYLPATRCTSAAVTCSRPGFASRRSFSLRSSACAPVR